MNERIFLSAAMLFFAATAILWLPQFFLWADWVMQPSRNRDLAETFRPKPIENEPWTANF